MHPTLHQWQTLHKVDLQSPKIAWPTVLLFVVSLAGFLGSTLLALLAIFPLSLAFFCNAIMQFIMFTVLHDASHRSLSQYSWLNDGMGNIASFILTPLGSVKVFRFIHMQHHRFTNENIKNDPDYWAAKGPGWLFPLRWMAMDIHYMLWYRCHWQQRPAKERRELLLNFSLTVVLLVMALTTGYTLALMLLWLLPSRLATLLLVLAFDYLPHYPHDVTAKENELHATNLKPELAWLMTPVLLSQNYHLIHHLYPRIPFYRYPWVWKTARNPLLDSGARLMSWDGQHLQREAYRRKSTSKQNTQFSCK
ncbi:MAG: fatty acid desaturase [Legionellaceae bacterium]|nr:fatty acid desaturase [Legionellaceae bacterium]